MLLAIKPNLYLCPKVLATPTKCNVHVSVQRLLRCGMQHKNVWIIGVSNTVIAEQLLSNPQCVDCCVGNTVIA